MKLKKIFYFLITFSSYLSLIILNSCQDAFVNKVDRVTTVTTIKVIFDNSSDFPVDPTSDNDNKLCSSTTRAAFWGLPPITFEKWRPNIHIKASTDNGNLKKRFWEVTMDVNPDVYSLFEYSQILYYDSNYIQANIDSTKDATVDNNVIMPLAFEQKIYKRSIYEAGKYDVSYDFNQKAVVITLNTLNSNYLVLKPGARVAVFATQRPVQWGEVNDYTIIDSLPGDNSLAKSSDSQSLKDNTTDRKSTRTLGYLTYDGKETVFKQDAWTGDWFEGIKLESEKITIYMSAIKDGDTAKKYWDEVDRKNNGVSIRPFMLFWIAIQQ